MATVNKNFKVKNGLIVEGSTATVNNHDILTKKQDDQDYIVGLIGGTATSANTADTVVKRDANGDFAAGEITADLVGDVTGQVSDISNHSTSDLTEGTNLYFTDSRAVSAVTGLDDSLYYPLTEKSGKAGVNKETVASTLAGGNGLVVGGTNPQSLTIDTNFIATTSYADNAESDAVTSANSYTDGRETAITTAYEAYADQAEVDAKTYADGLAVNYDAAGSAAAAQTAAEGFATQAIANLVDSAPATLDTLNELAAALQDNPDIISDLQDIAAGKQDELTAGANIDITGATISVTGLDTADVAEDASNLYFTDARAREAISDGDGISYNSSTGVISVDLGVDSGLTTSDGTLKIKRSAVDTWYDANGAAATAETNANSYTDTEIGLLDTDDIEEGSTNEYFTNDRAQNATKLLLTGTQTILTNIQITENGFGGLNITAENGVSDSDTDDLTEGTTNLYFTNTRAVDALEAVVPNFTAVEINSLAKQVAATTSVATASQVTAYEFLGTEYRSAKFLVKTAQGSHTEVSEVLLTMDSSNNIAITEYAMVGTNGSLMTITADYVEVGTTVRLRVTTANNTSVVNVVGTLLA
jgi:hypothetical protein